MSVGARVWAPPLALTAVCAACRNPWMMPPAREAKLWIIHSQKPVIKINFTRVSAHSPSSAPRTASGMKVKTTVIVRSVP